MRRAIATLAAAAACLVAPGVAHADRWVLTGASSIPNQYWQGLTTDPADKRVFFIGVFQGLWRTTPLLRQTAGVPAEIPAAVTSTAGYNHIGDPTWNPREGGRVLLPLECYTPGVGNTCGTGAFGVADPATLAWRYEVPLDPAEIPKAMWAETSPDGKLVWTSGGNDLLAYRSSEITAGHAPLRAARRLAGAVPPSGVTGAVFSGGRLLLAGTNGSRDQIWSIDPRTGKRKLEVEQSFCGESEGLDLIDTLGGELHWLVGPDGGGCTLTYGPTSALLHFVRRPGLPGLRVGVLSATSTQVKVRVTRRSAPVRGARASFAGFGARTDADGRATIHLETTVTGRFKTLARAGRRYGLSKLVTLDL